MKALALPEGETLGHRLLTGNRYALVAAENRHQLPAEIVALPIAQGVLADSAELMPVLIETDRLSEGQRVVLMNCMDGARASGEAPILSALLASEAPAQRLVSHIAAAQLRGNDKGETAWLRMHDPRVWLHLPRIVNDSDLRALYGPVTRWSVCIGGQWVANEPTEGHQSRSNWSRTNAAQWAALGRIGPVNRVLAKLRLLSHEELIEHSQQIDELVARAESFYGLTAAADLVAFATLGMTIHPRFDEFPIATHARDEYEKSKHRPDAESDFNVVDAFLAITPEQWTLGKRALEIKNKPGAST